MEEIKQELRQDNLAVKANAINKLNYVSIIFVQISSPPVMICSLEISTLCFILYI